MNGTKPLQVQLAVDGEIKERTIAGSSMLIKKEADRPDLTGLERALCADLASSVPRHPLTSGGIEFHDTSPVAMMANGMNVQPSRMRHVQGPPQCVSKLGKFDKLT